MGVAVASSPADSNYTSRSNYQGSKPLKGALILWSPSQRGHRSLLEANIQLAGTYTKACKRLGDMNSDLIYDRLRIYPRAMRGVVHVSKARSPRSETVKHFLKLENRFWWKI